MDNYWGSGGPGDTMEETESQPVKPDEGSEEVGEKEEGGEMEEGKGEEKRGTKRSAKERLGKRRVPIDRLVFTQIHLKGKDFEKVTKNSLKTIFCVLVKFRV